MIYVPCEIDTFMDLPYLIRLRLLQHVGLVEEFSEHLSCSARSHCRIDIFGTWEDNRELFVQDFSSLLHEMGL